MTIPHRHTTRLAVAGLVAAAGLGLAGCGNEDTGTDVEDITEGEVAESSPAAEATDGMTGAVPPVTPYRGPYNQQYYDEQQVYEGQEVALTGEVEEVLSDQAFEISDPDDAELGSLLVLHTLEEPPALEDGQLVEVVGAVQASFDPATAAEQLGIELNAEGLEDHQDEGWVQATEVSTDMPTDAATEGGMGGGATDSP